MTVVAVGAHPDDIEIGCYGTLAKLSVNHEVYLFIFTAGEITAPRLERIREAEESGKLIGAKVNVLDYPDGAVPVDGEVIGRFSEEIKALNPQVVFTLYPEDTHQDHRAVSRITLSSCRYVPKILFYETAHTKSGFAPNYYVDITDYFDIKEKALKCHRTQKNKPYLHIDELRGLSRYRANNVCLPGRLFEAFILYRSIN